MDRRAFLRACALATGAAFVGACTRKDALRDLFVGGDDHVAGMNNYLAFAIPGLERDSIGIRFTQRGTVVGPLVARAQRYAEPAEGLQSPLFYATEVTFPAAGIWDVQADGARPTVIQVRAPDDPGPPVVGSLAVSVQTPTVADDTGVDPLCTRAPACPFHGISLDAALQASEPVAFFVGSPRFCRSRTCAPNLDELIIAARDSNARVIHAEFHPDDRPDTIRRYLRAPAVRAWRLESEPWLFLVDRRGRVVDRFQGPVAAERIRPALARLR